MGMKIGRRMRKSRRLSLVLSVGICVNPPPYFQGAALLVTEDGSATGPLRAAGRSRLRRKKSFAKIVNRIHEG